MRSCPLHGIFCKNPRNLQDLIAYHRAHANIPLHLLDPHNVPAQDPRTHRYGKTRRDHRSGAWAQRIANRAKRAEENRG